MNKTVQMIISAIGGLVASFFNVYGYLLGIMIGAIVFDLVTGVIKAAKNGNLSSEKGTQGFFKKVIYLVSFFFGIFLDTFITYMLYLLNVKLPFELPFALIITFYIVLNECISICENIYEIDSRAIPAWVVKILKIGKNKIEDMGNKDEEI